MMFELIFSYILESKIVGPTSQVFNITGLQVLYTIEEDTAEVPSRWRSPLCQIRSSSLILRS